MTGLSSVVGLGAAVGVALVAVIWCSMPYRHRPMLEQVPAFALCENDWGQPCHPDLPTRWLTDFYEVLSQRAQKVALDARRPVVLHIGANAFHDDVLEYKPLLQAIGRGGPAPRLVLVEPERDHREKLLRVYTRLGLQAEDVIVVSAAMDKDCDGDLIQYIFGDQMFLDFVPNDKYIRKDLRASLRSWRSSDKNQLSKTLRGVGSLPKYVKGEASAAALDRFHKVFVPIIRKMYEAGNWTKYIVEETVPCMHASKLLKEVDVRPEDIVMTTCDAEGFDVPIMQGFIELPQFRPSLVKWEGFVTDAKALIQFFLDNSYMVGKTQSGHGDDVVAYSGPRV